MTAECAFYTAQEMNQPEQKKWAKIELIDFSTDRLSCRSMKNQPNLFEILVHLPNFFDQFC